MKTESVTALLEDMVPAGLVKSIWDVEELVKIAERPNLALPALYVASENVTGTPPIEGSYVLDQTLNSTALVVIVLRPDGARIGRAKPQLDVLRDAVLERLFGVQPDGWDSVLTVGDIRNLGRELPPGLIGRAIRMRGRTRIRKIRDAA
jgi:hypothetical protein